MGVSSYVSNNDIRPVGEECQPHTSPLPAYRRQAKCRRGNHSGFISNLGNFKLVKLMIVLGHGILIFENI